MQVLFLVLHKVEKLDDLLVVLQLLQVPGLLVVY